MGVNDIDAKIAEHLFGNKSGYYPAYGFQALHVVAILEALRKKGFTISISYDTADGKSNCLCTIFKIPPVDVWDAEEESLPLALCKAALLALGVK